MRCTPLKCAAALLLFPLVLAAAPQDPKYRVIVNPENPATTIERRALANMFLKKTTRWSHGETAEPVDLPPKSEVRQQFADEVLDRSVSAVKSYWQQLLFSGRDVPPPEVSSDEAVVRFVLTHRGGVGYVSAQAELRGAKVITVR